MAAFQLIDEENNKISYGQNLVAIEDVSTMDNNNDTALINYIRNVRRSSSVFSNPMALSYENSVKWRQRPATMSHGVRQPLIVSTTRRASTTTTYTPDWDEPAQSPRSQHSRLMSESSLSFPTTPQFSPTPPVLGAYISRRRSTKKNRIYPPQQDVQTSSPTAQQKRVEESASISPGSEQ